MDKKEDFNTVEEYLRNYKIYRVGLINIQTSLMEILPNMFLESKKVRAIDGEETEIYLLPTNIINRMAGSRVVYLIDQLNIYSKLVEWINEMLDDLSDEQQLFTKYRYFRGYSIDKTAQYLNCSVQKCFKIRVKILEKLSAEYHLINGRQ